MGAIMVGASPYELYDVPSPTSIKFGYNDVSSSDAGRTNDANATMHKDVIARKRTIALAWKNLDGAATKAVLQAFGQEYFYVRYLEPEDDAYVIRKFYAGDKSVGVGTYYTSASFVIGGVLYESVSFNVIEV